MIHHTRIYVNLRAYEQNLRYLMSLLEPGVQLCAVVKADAYGHGIDRIAPVAVRCGAGVLGIVDNWEAQRIRDLGIRTRLLRLRPATFEEAHEALRWDVEEIVGDVETGKCYSQLGLERQRPLPVHLKMDVGIGRMGFSLPRDTVHVRQICELPGLDIKGVMTHFPCADESDLTVTLEQLDRFNNVLASLASSLPPQVIRHAANSAAMLRIESSHYDLVRLGIVTYGLQPTKVIDLPASIRPVMEWKTTVTQVRTVPEGATIGYGMTCRLDRDRRLATLPMGYADGYLRAFSNKSSVLIHGKRCPVAGRISMDLTVVDVSHVPQTQAGDEVVLMGTQGEEMIKAEELAGLADTINYEITCLAGRINRSKKTPQDN